MACRALRYLGAPIVALLALMSTPVQAVTPVGTVVENKATVTFLDAATGLRSSVSTNISRFRVAALTHLTLTEDRQVQALAGQAVNLPHRLVNAGNVGDSYALSVENLEGDAGDLDGLAVYHDLNGNGIGDPGEPLLGETALLKPGDEIAVVVSGTVPAQLVVADQLQLRLIAQSLSGPAAGVNIDTVTLGSGVFIRLSKFNAPSCTQPITAGETVRYTIRFTNTGDALPTARELMVDGTKRTGVMIEDEVPANTALFKPQTLAFAPFQGIPVMLPLRDLGASSWMRLDHWDGSEPIAKIGLLLPPEALAPNHHGEISFSVRALDSVTAGSRISNQAGVDLDGDGTLDFTSAAVCNAIAGIPGGGSAPALRFTQPTAALRASATAPNFHADSDFEDAGLYHLSTGVGGYDAVRDGIYVEMHASGFNRSSLVADGADGSILVRVTALGTGDSVLMVMLETGPNTGVFRSIQPLVAHETLEGNGGVCPSAGPFEPKYTSSPAAGCVLRNLLSGTLQASVVDPHTGNAMVDTALVDPLGVVFDSRTLEPVAGARVQIRNTDGTPALDPLSGGTATLPAQVTGADGRYQFPNLYPGSYYVDVTPPEDYLFPSSIPPAMLIGRSVGPYSYGLDGIDGLAGTGVFRLDAGDLPLIVDIPLDSNQPVPFSIEKTVLQPRVDIGGLVAYSVRLVNGSTATLQQVRLIDRLPYGFKYMHNSARLDGERIETPAGGAGPELAFRLGALAPGKEVLLTYVLQATAGALDSDGTNVARAFATLNGNVPVMTAEARARVEIDRRGVLSDRAILFGKLYIDGNCNELQDPGEWPVGGVRLYLEDGTFAITDENGQYSLYGLRPGNHVIKVDRLTLPEGLRMVPISNRHGGNGDSRFADLRPGEFHRADFAAACLGEDAEAVLALVKARNDDINGHWMLDEASSLLPRQPADDDRGRAGTDGDLSSGVVDGPQSRRPGEKASSARKAAQTPEPYRGYSLQIGLLPAAAPAEAMIEALPPRLRSQAFAYPIGDQTAVRVGFVPDREALMATKAELGRVGHDATIVGSEFERVPPSKALQFADAPPETMPLAQELAKAVTREQGKAGTWFWPQGDISLDGRFMVGLRAGVEPTLFVNGRAVSKDRLGGQIVNTREQAQVLAWYGVPLEEGDNLLEVKARDPFGNERVMAERRFKHPAAGVVMRLVPAVEELAADGGRSTLAVDVLMEDRHGYPARGTHYVTIEASDGRWLEPDLQQGEPGQQMKVSNGRGRIHLRSSDSPGPVKLQASTGELRAEVDITQVAAPRPLVASGLLDIRGRRGSFDGSHVLPSAQHDAADHPSRVDGRAAVFVKGKVKGDMQLTLSYDTDKDTDTDLFRDIDPSSTYPIHGDAGVRGYEAQSRSRLHAKLERGKSSVMWGDYLSDARSENQLQRVQRSLTGANAHVDLGRTRVSGFAARVEDGRTTEELRGNGTAMNYRLSGAPIVRNSEQLEIIVRDRDNTGLIVSREPLSRFGDYQLDPLSGTLVFHRVIPTLDEDLNPVFVRAGYDLERGGDEHTVAGVRLEHDFTENLSGGVSYTRDGDPLDGNRLRGAHLAYEVGTDTRVFAEVASMDHSDDKPDAEAFLFQVDRDWSPDSNTSLVWARAGEGFDNSNSIVGAGRHEVRLVHRQRLNEELDLALEGLRSESLSGDDERSSVAANVSWQVGDWRLTGGARHIEQEANDNRQGLNTGTLGAERDVSLFGRDGRLKAEVEQDLSGEDRRAVRLGGELQVHEKSRLYGRYEFINSETGITALSTGAGRHTLSVGSETDWLTSTRTFSEYRLRGGIDGRDMETANGVRATFEPAPGLSIAPTLEVVDTLEGDDSGDGVAVSLAFQDTRDPNSRKAARAEVRRGQSVDYYGVRGSFASRLNEDWTWLIREHVTRSEPADGESSLQHELTLGLTRRPREDNAYHELFMYQWKEDRGPADAADRSVHLVSTHQNYQASADLTLSGRLGAKWERVRLAGDDYSGAAVVADGRLILELGPRWDIDLHGGVLLTGGLGGARYAAGAGVNYLVRENLRIGVGYNVVGFREDDLDPEGYNARGLYFGAQLKFDEDDLKWLGD